jgi:hypothetical protein
VLLPVRYVTDVKFIILYILLISSISFRSNVIKTVLTLLSFEYVAISIIRILLRENSLSANMTNSQTHIYTHGDIHDDRYIRIYSSKDINK